MEQPKTRLWTIELNLDDDPLNSCAWHIDELKLTCVRNLRHCIDKEETDRWVLVSIVESADIPWGEADELRRIIAKTRLKEGIDKELREPYGLEALLFDSTDPRRK